MNNIITNDVKQIEEEQYQNLKNMIKEYVNIDNEIRNIMKIKKEHNDRKSELSLKILAYMNQLELDDINIGNDGKLQKKESKTTQGLSMPYIKTKIEEQISDSEVVQKIMNVIKSDRVTKSKYVLKRTYK